eukprot:3232030-Rhodomonas_salina.1
MIALYAMLSGRGGTGPCARTVCYESTALYAMRVRHCSTAPCAMSVPHRTLGQYHTVRNVSTAPCAMSVPHIDGAAETEQTTPCY